MNWYDTAVLALLGVDAVQDIRKKEILLIPTVLFAAAGVLIRIEEGGSVPDLLTGLIPGGILAAVSLLSRGSAGMGDAVVLAAVGVWTGGKGAFLTAVTALFIQAAVAVVYRLTGGRKKELPFIPAVCAAYALLVLIG